MVIMLLVVSVARDVLKQLGVRCIRAVILNMHVQAIIQMILHKYNSFVDGVRKLILVIKILVKYGKNAGLMNVLLAAQTIHGVNFVD